MVVPPPIPMYRTLPPGTVMLAPGLTVSFPSTNRFPVRVIESPVSMKYSSVAEYGTVPEVPVQCIGAALILSCEIIEIVRVIEEIIL